ncbi:MAG: FkbM family methyltransferase [Pseudomonadota bacterium]
MTIRGLIRKALEKILRAKIYRATPRGVDQIADVKRSFPTYDPSVVFDVGANIGQSTDEYLLQFPNARVFCFEPSRSTYEKLTDHFSGSSRVQCLNLALADKPGTALLEKTKASVNRRLVNESQNGPPSGETEKVSIGTVDEICAKNDIQTIDYLKIDTEGHELSVLAGSAQMLDAENIKMVELELGMNPENTRHTPFEDGKRILEKNGFRLLTISEQVHEFRTRQPHLRRVNAVFVSRAMITS